MSRQGPHRSVHLAFKRREFDVLLLQLGDEFVSGLDLLGKVVPFVLEEGERSVLWGAKAE